MSNSSIFVEQNEGAFMVYGEDIEPIDDLDLERLVQKIISEPELNLAYHLGEIEFIDLSNEDEEEIRGQLDETFLNENVFYHDDDRDQNLSAGNYLSPNLDFVYGDLK